MICLRNFEKLGSIEIIGLLFENTAQSPALNNGMTHAIFISSVTIPLVIDKLIICEQVVQQ
jgi:hypothetical protein